MKTRAPIQGLFYIALRMQLLRTITQRYTRSLRHLQPRASGIDRASNKMYERELHAEPRSALYDPFDIDTGSAGGYDSANRLRQYQRGTLNSTNGYLNQGGGKITSPISLPDTDTQRTYDLDGLGNWKRTDFCRAGLGLPSSGDVVTDLRQHNKLNQITSRDREGAGKAIFVYDSNGNLQDDGTLLYEYDALNRLIEVKRKSDSAVIGQYVYDAQNRRISKTVSNGGLSGNLPNGRTAYLYHNWQVIEERDSDDETTKQYVWGEYIDELIQMKTAVASGGGNLPAGDYYPLQDLLYRNTALTDSTGAIVETYDTDAYGNTLIFKAAGTNSNWWADDVVQTDNPACEVIYCGYRYDPETELYYVRHRTYNPVLGRWIQRDPLGYVDGLNLYRYVESNPISFLDFSGMATRIGGRIFPNPPIIGGPHVPISPHGPGGPPAGKGRYEWVPKWVVWSSSGKGVINKKPKAMSPNLLECNKHTGEYSWEAETRERVTKVFVDRYIGSGHLWWYDPTGYHITGTNWKVTYQDRFVSCKCKNGQYQKIINRRWEDEGVGSTYSIPRTRTIYEKVWRRQWVPYIP